MKHAGFTLMELLVVIISITIFTAIALPVLRTSRDHAKAIVCSTNVKKLTFAVIGYDELHGSFPYGFDYKTHGATNPPGGYVGDASLDGRGWWWFQCLMTDYREAGSGSGLMPVLWCPARRIRDPGIKENVLCANYGVNRSVCTDADGPRGSAFIGSPHSREYMRRYSRTLLVVDSGYALISWLAASQVSSPVFEDPRREANFYLPGLSINRKRNIAPGCREDAINGRHPGKTVNVGFADGYVKRIKAEELAVEDNISGSNLSPLWVPQ